MEAKKVVDTQKANELIDHLNQMTNDEVAFAFENMNYDGLLHLNCLISHVLVNVCQNVREQIKKEQH